MLTTAHKSNLPANPSYLLCRIPRPSSLERRLHTTHVARQGSQHGSLDVIRLRQGQRLQRGDARRMERSRAAHSHDLLVVLELARTNINEHVWKCAADIKQL
eukprot:1158905-Pelagomonas_calceolata.AAC.1